MTTNQAGSQKPLDEESDEFLDKLYATAAAYGHTEPDKLGRYRMSSLPYCLRKLYFKIKENQLEIVEKKEDVSYLQTLGLSGHALHMFFDHLFKEMDILHAAEEEVTIQCDDFVIVGHFDAILQWEQEYYVVDVKSIYSFEHIPNEFHLDQLSLYQYCFEGMPGMLIYVKRDRFDVARVNVNYNRARAQKMINRAHRLHNLLQVEKIPLKTTEVWQCKNCIYKDRCK